MTSPLTTMSLKTFLSSARTALAAPVTTQRHSPLTFVVGNESADLDSICSAIVLAYLRSAQTSPPSLHIPLANLTRDDLALRTEMAAVLAVAGISPLDILTLSDLPSFISSSSPSSPSNNTTWLLVDHNSLTGPLSHYQPSVIGVIDHHADEGLISPTAKPRIIEKCGSCMSLIVEETRPLWENLRAEDAERAAKVGLAPILIDTINLADENKVTPTDLSAAAFLRSKITSASFDTDQYFRRIHAVKEDVSQLSLRDILRKDYKEWSESGLKLGVSCSVQGFDYILSDKTSSDPAALYECLSTWAAERELDVASIMTTLSPGGVFQRELLVWARSQKGLEVLQKFEDISGVLQLKSWGKGHLDKEGGKAWQQKNLAASRKQVAPLLRDAMRNL